MKQARDARIINVLTEPVSLKIIEQIFRDYYYNLN